MPGLAVQAAVVSSPPASRQQSGADALVSDALGSLSLGWSFLSSAVSKGAELAVSGAESIGQQLTETVIKPTAAAIRDPEFKTNVSSTLNSIQSKVLENGSRGISFVSNLINNGPNSQQNVDDCNREQKDPSNFDDWNSNERKKSLDWDEWKDGTSAASKGVTPKAEALNNDDGLDRWGRPITSESAPSLSSDNLGRMPNQEEDIILDRWGRPRGDDEPVSTSKVVALSTVEKTRASNDGWDDWGNEKPMDASSKISSMAQPDGLQHRVVNKKTSVVDDWGWKDESASKKADNTSQKQGDDDGWDW
ncbi:hypothetical protein HDU97_004599 [Phlyctochytrium planicorne]|nr:hypothetical protein HDU97_004599 [Phlyctochytrium planicorne]